MADPLVLIDSPHPGITTISLNRPDKRNALNLKLLQTAIEAIEYTQSLSDQRVIILRGEGQAFCAGLDLKEATDLEKAHHSAQAVSRLLQTLFECPLVTIAAVHGATLAGGAGLMTACDLAVASESMFTGYPETRRGLVAGLVLTFLLRLVPERQARELLLLGDRIDAHEALSMGLVNRVVADDQLLSCALEMGQSACLGGPKATAHTKELIRSMSRPVEGDLNQALNDHMAARQSPEAQEGMRAFLEKRDPSWVEKVGL